MYHFIDFSHHTTQKSTLHSVYSNFIFDHKINTFLHLIVTKAIGYLKPHKLMYTLQANMTS